MQLTFMQTQNLHTERQTQTGAILTAGSGLVYHIESLRDFLQLLLRNPHAIIFHTEGIGILPSLAVYFHQSSLTGGLAGIIHQIQQHGFQQIPLCIHRPFSKGYPKLLFRISGKHAFQIVKKGFCRHRLTLYGIPFRHNDIQQAKGHIFQPLALGVNIIGRQKMLLLIQFPGSEQIRISYDSGQRCLQLMGKSGDKILSGSHFFPQLTDGGLQFVGHAVEIHGQLAQLVTADLPGPVTVISPGHFPGSMRQKPNGFGQPGTDQKHNHGTAEQHSQSHLPVNGESQRPLFEYLRHILQCLQIHIPVQRIYHDARMYVIMLPQRNHLPDSGILRYLLQKRGVLRKTVAYEENLLLLIGQAQETP